MNSSCIHAPAQRVTAAVAPTAKHRFDGVRHAPATIGLILLLTVAAPARAVDGCQVLLCFAAPSWRAIPQCVPPITQVLRDLARGKPFPTCNMSGPGNSAGHAWSNPPAFCPPQYTHSLGTENGLIYTCDYMGAVSVMVDGTLFSRTWWTMDGGTSTEFSPAAKSQFTTWDTRFDDDYADWLSAQPPVVPSETGN